jgi:hypothetical protein
MARDKTKNQKKINNLMLDISKITCTFASPFSGVSFIEYRIASWN